MKLPPPDLPPPSLLPPVVPSPSAAPEPERRVDAVLNPYSPPASPLEVEESSEPDLDFASGSWGRVVNEALSYPLRGSNIIGLVLLGIVVLFVSLTAFAFIIGIAAFLGGMAYIASYYFEVVQHTINKKSDMPAWPDLSSYWDDIVIPGFQMLIITLLSYLPLGLVLWMQPEDPERGLSLLEIAGHVYAWAYFPMATLAIVCSGTLQLALPHQVIPAISRCLPGYLLCVLLFGLTEIVRAAVGVLLGNMFVLGMLIPGVIGVYGMLVQARLAGMIYLRSSEKLPW